MCQHPGSHDYDVHDDSRDEGFHRCGNENKAVNTLDRRDVQRGFRHILTFITPGALAEILTGTPGGVHVSQGLLLVFAVLLEIPVAMIFLSRTLSYGPNRWANIIACAVTTAFVVGGGSAYLHYYFFAAIEVACMAGIAWSAWKWPNPEAPEGGAGAD